MGQRTQERDNLTTLPALTSAGYRCARGFPSFAGCPLPPVRCRKTVRRLTKDNGQRTKDVPQEIYQHIFANGLTLLAERMEHVRSAALNFLVPAGCVYDPPDSPGLASGPSEMITRGAGERRSRAL